jgi:hypothetical protein
MSRPTDLAAEKFAVSSSSPHVYGTQFQCSIPALPEICLHHTTTQTFQSCHGHPTALSNTDATVSPCSGEFFSRLPLPKLEKQKIVA